MGSFKFVNTYSSGSKAVHRVLSNIVMNKDNREEIQTTNAHHMAKKHTIPLPYHVPCSSFETVLFILNWIVLEKFTCAVYKLN
eukprot:4641363-Ditylum_brightwellii.AAC.1